MKNQILRVIALSTTIFTAAPASAQESAFDLSANAGFVSEYSFRGIAQSNEKPAVQGGFDVSHETGLYAGVWGSNVDFNDGDEATIETDFYAGFSNEFKGLTYDVGAIYYAYPGADSDLNYDFTEYSFALGHDFDLFSTVASVYYSPEFFADSGDATYTSLAIDVPLPADFSFATHIGYQSVEENTAYGVPDYTDWSAGLGYAIQGFDLSLTYIDTDLDEPSECRDGCAERVIAGISRSF